MKATDESPESTVTDPPDGVSVSAANADVGSDELADLQRQTRSALERADASSLIQSLVVMSPVAALEWLLEVSLDESTQQGAEMNAALERAFLGAAALSLPDQSETRNGASVDAGAAMPVELVARAAARLGAFCSPETALKGARRLRAAGRPAEGDALLDAALDRFSEDPLLLRDRADRAVRAGDVEGHQWLSRLAAVDSGAASALRIYRQRAKLPVPDHQAIRVALLSSFTIDSVVPHLDQALRDLELVPDLHTAPFGTWERAVLDPQDALRSFAPEIAFLSVSIDDLIPSLVAHPDSDALARLGGEALDRIVGAARNFASWSDAPLIVHGFHCAHPDPLGILEGRGGPSRTRWIADLNAQLRDRLSELPRVFVLDMVDLISRRSGGEADGAKLRHMASMRLTEEVSVAVGRAYSRYVSPLMGRTRKCVVLDLDNTLWGGVVGEDGPGGIRLGNTAPGSEFQEFQHFLLGLTEQGILLAINSKNNPEDAWEVIRDHDGMILREKHFSAARINWQPKPENLMEIARELDIGTDSLIFVDDNPNERERVRQFLPSVLVPELPTDPALYRRTLEALPELQRLETTVEDKNRVELYRAKKERENAQSGASSVEEYLESLGIGADIAQADDSTLPRVHQLFQRTNQFNATTRRYDAGELENLSADPKVRLYVLRARDRFGDHGLVAVALVRIGDAGWLLDSFLMSCRVIGYGIETALLATISEDARASGVDRLLGEFIPTAKNAPVKGLYADHGFEASQQDGECTIYDRSIGEGPIARPPWVEIAVSNDA